MAAMKIIEVVNAQEPAEQAIKQQEKALKQRKANLRLQKAISQARRVAATSTPKRKPASKL
jgi:hypothetical protein